MPKISIVNRKFRNVTFHGVEPPFPPFYFPCPRIIVNDPLDLLAITRVYLHRNVLFRGKIFSTHHPRITHTHTHTHDDYCFSRKRYIKFVSHFHCYFHPWSGMYLYGLSCLLLFNIEDEEFLKREFEIVHNFSSRLFVNIV